MKSSRNSVTRRVGQMKRNSEKGASRRKPRKHRNMSGLKRCFTERDSLTALAIRNTEFNRLQDSKVIKSHFICKWYAEFAHVVMFILFSVSK